MANTNQEPYLPINPDDVFVDLPPLRQSRASLPREPSHEDAGFVQMRRGEQEEYSDDDLDDDYLPTLEEIEEQTERVVFPPTHPGANRQLNEQDFQEMIKKNEIEVTKVMERAPFDRWIDYESDRIGRYWFSVWCRIKQLEQRREIDKLNLTHLRVWRRRLMGNYSAEEKDGQYVTHFNKGITKRINPCVTHPLQFKEDFIRDQNDKIIKTVRTPYDTPSLRPVSQWAAGHMQRVKNGTPVEFQHYVERKEEGGKKVTFQLGGERKRDKKAKLVPGEMTRLPDLEPSCRWKKVCLNTNPKTPSIFEVTWWTEKEKDFFQACLALIKTANSDPELTPEEEEEFNQLGVELQRQIYSFMETNCHPPKSWLNLILALFWTLGMSPEPNQEEETTSQE